MLDHKTAVDKVKKKKKSKPNKIDIPRVKEKSQSTNEIDCLFAKKKFQAANEIDSLFAKKKSLPISEIGSVASQKTVKPKMDDPRGLKSRARLLTADGLPIYTVEEMHIGGGGDTPECPFDCQCCF